MYLALVLPLFLISLPGVFVRASQIPPLVGICAGQMEELLEDSQPVLGVPPSSSNSPEIQSENPSEPPSPAQQISDNGHLKKKVILRRKCHFVTQTATKTIQDCTTAFVTPIPSKIVSVNRKLIAKKTHIVTVTNPIWVGTLTATTCPNPVIATATYMMPTATTVVQVWHTTGPADCSAATPVTIQIETVIEDEGC